MTKRFGFTLAEVLITLGIIGVVAAMTIPTLIANTNGQKFRSQFKKTLSTLNQAALMSQEQYGFNYAGIETFCDEIGDTDDPTKIRTICSLLNGTLTGATFKDAGRVTYVYSLVNVSGFSGSSHQYTLADGSIVAVPPFLGRGKSCTLPLGKVIDSDILANDLKDCIGYIDVNGLSGPNKEVTCADGTATLSPDATCTVPNNSANLTDVFPVVFHDATVEPATNAAKYVLTTAK